MDAMTLIRERIMMALAQGSETLRSRPDGVIKLTLASEAINVGFKLGTIDTRDTCSSVYRRPVGFEGIMGQGG